MSATATTTERRPAKCLAMSGGYFAGWLTKRKPRLTFAIKQARPFFDDFDLQDELDRIERRGLSATVIDVTLRIG